MRIARFFALGLVALALAAGPYRADAKAADGQVDMGDFLRAYARAVGIELPAEASAGTLLASLRASGVKLDADIDLAKPLKQGDVARIGSANGLRISTSTPDRAFTSLQVEVFFATYGWALGRPGESGQPAVHDSSAGLFGGGAIHANTDKGKKKGRPFQSASEPDPGLR